MIESGKKVLVIGELNVDIISSGLLTEPVLGQEIIAESFEITLGSASAIFACGIAKLGNRVTFVSKVGKDNFGEFCLEKLSERRISVEFVEKSEQFKTGVTIVLSTRQDRAMITYLGAIADLAFADIPSEIFEDQAHLHLTSYFLQSKLRPDFSRLIDKAKNNGLTVSFDPNSDPTQKWDNEIFDVIKRTDILFLNEIEAKQLTARQNSEEAIYSLGKVCDCVVIKLGAGGAIALRDGELRKENGFSVEAVDTTGAGDSFAAGFVHAYLEGKNLSECLQTGNACGALSTTKAGGTNAQPDLKELNYFLVNTQKKVFADR